MDRSQSSSRFLRSVSKTQQETWKDAKSEPFNESVAQKPKSASKSTNPTPGKAKAKMKYEPVPLSELFKKEKKTPSSTLTSARKCIFPAKLGESTYGISTRRSLASNCFREIMSSVKKAPTNTKTNYEPVPLRELFKNEKKTFSASARKSLFPSKVGASSTLGVSTRQSVAPYFFQQEISGGKEAQQNAKMMYKPVPRFEWKSDKKTASSTLASTRKSIFPSKVQQSIQSVSTRQSIACFSRRAATSVKKTSQDSPKSLHPKLLRSSLRRQIIGASNQAITNKTEATSRVSTSPKVTAQHENQEQEATDRIQTRSAMKRKSVQPLPSSMKKSKKKGTPKGSVKWEMDSSLTKCGIEGVSPLENSCDDISPSTSQKKISGRKQRNSKSVDDARESRAASQLHHEPEIEVINLENIVNRVPADRKNLLALESHLVDSLKVVRKMLEEKPEISPEEAESVAEEGEKVTEQNVGPLIDHSYSIVLPKIILNRIGNKSNMELDADDNLECEIVSNIQENEDSFIQLEQQLNIVSTKNQLTPLRKVHLNSVENFQQSNNPALREYIALRTRGGILNTPKNDSALKKTKFQTPRSKISSNVLKQLEHLYENS